MGLKPLRDPLQVEDDGCALEWSHIFLWGQQIKPNIIYFYCACATLICLNQNKQNGIHNTLLKELGCDQFSPLQVLLPKICITYTSLIGFMMLPQFCIRLISSPRNVYSRNLDSLCFVCSQNALFESRKASRQVLRVSTIFPRIFYLLLPFLSHNLLIGILMISVVVIRPYVIHIFPQS
jgi:hypothetical protein